MRGLARLGWCGLILSLCVGCAGAGEVAAGEGEAEPPVVAEASVVEPAPASAADVREPNAPRAAAAATSAEREPEPERVFDSRWVDQVRTVAATYESWGRIDDEARWAPWLCRMPRAATARISDSDDPGTHGHKLYTLYALDPEAYGAPRSAMVSGAEDLRALGMSQVIVKESFTPVPLDDARDAKLGVDPSGGVGGHGLQPAVRDGQRFVAGERRGLYLMMKPETPTEGTDAGWIYATVEPDLITVTAVGVIESCAECHAEAGDERLFGLPGYALPTSHGLRDHSDVRAKARANAAP